MPLSVVGNTPLFERGIDCSNQSGASTYMTTYTSKELWIKIVENQSIGYFRSDDWWGIFSGVWQKGIAFGCNDGELSKLWTDKEEWIKEMKNSIFEEYAI